MNKSINKKTNAYSNKTYVIMRSPRCVGNNTSVVGVHADAVLAPHLQFVWANRKMSNSFVPSFARSFLRSFVRCNKEGTNGEQEGAE